MNEVEFFNVVVKPTVDDFRKNPADIRLGSLSCIALSAMTEHYYAHHEGVIREVLGCKDAEAFKLKLDKIKAFEQIKAIANGTKHAVLDRGVRKGQRPFHELHLEEPAKLGVLRCGFPISSEPHLFVDSNCEWLLYQLTDYVLERWQNCIDKDISALFEK